MCEEMTERAVRWAWDRTSLTSASWGGLIRNAFRDHSQPSLNLFAIQREKELNSQEAPNDLMQAHLKQNHGTAGGRERGRQSLAARPSAEEGRRTRVFRAESCEGRGPGGAAPA